MTDFISQYRAAFEAVGRPLTAADAISEDELEAAQQRLGHKLPKALLDFYRVAGNAGYFGNLNELEKTENWSEECVEETGYLIFMADRYGICVLGITVPSQSLDPIVLLSSDVEHWNEWAKSFSQFMICMVYCEATDGLTMPFTARGEIDDSTRDKLDSKWDLAAQTTRYRAYNHKGLAVFLWQTQSGWEIRVGAIERKELEAISRELSISLEETTLN